MKTPPLLRAFWNFAPLWTSLGLWLGNLPEGDWIRKATGWFAGVGILLSGAYVLGSHVTRERARSSRARRFAQLRDPESAAAQFAASHGHTEPVVGSVIEIWAHPSLESMLPFHDLGVAPISVLFRPPSPGDFRHALDRCGGFRPYPQPPNLRKYGIAKLPLGTMDDDRLAVEFAETDFETWVSVREKIKADAYLRRELSDIAPEKSRVPQSMSLQFLVRFANGDVLAMRRKPGLDSYGGTWSLSGEEQLHQRDFAIRSVPVAEYLFRRAFIEEVFGHRGEDELKLNRIWEQDCTPIVHWHRVWSFFLEENVAIFQTFGVFQLRINAPALKALREDAASAGWGTLDPEGGWYVVAASQVDELLTKGSCQAERLQGSNDRQVIQASSLHATSRYRAWRLFCALNRTGETLTQLYLR